MRIEQADEENAESGQGRRPGSYQGLPGRGEFEAFRIECAELSERLEPLEARFEALINSSASR